MARQNKKSIGKMLGLFFIISFIFNVLFVARVKAVSVGDQAVIYGAANDRGYIELKFPNGTRVRNDNHTFSRADGTRVFCVEPLIPINSGATHTAYTAKDFLISGQGQGHFAGFSSGEDRRITEAKLEEAKLWVYYGWDSSPTKTADEYNAIQAKIWQIFWDSEVTYYNSSEAEVSILTNIWARVNELINNHGLMPKLSGQGYDEATRTLTLEAGETVTLVDSNNAIGKGVGKLNLANNNSNAKVEVENRKLTITAPETEDKGSLEFDRIKSFRSKPASIVWFSGTGQKLLDTKDPDDGKFILNFNSKPATGDIEFRKVDRNGELVAGGKFQLQTDTGSIVQDFTTKDGKLKLSDIKAGTYKIVEKEAPKGYKKGLDATVTVPAGGVVTASITNEVLKSPIVVQKYDLVKGLENPKETSLAGAKFEIVAIALDNPNSTPYKAGDIVDTLVTDDEGRAESRALYLGRYELREKEAPKGYLLNDEVVHFSVNEVGEEVKITQVTENTGAALDELNKHVEELNTTWKTKEAKREKEPLFEVNKPQVADSTITFADRHILGRIDLNKVLGEYYHKAGEPKKPEENIQFEVLDQDGNVIDTIITNKYGYGSSKYLPFGTYTLRQVTYTEYSYKVEDQTVVINEDLFNYTYQLENEEVVTRLRLVKLDQETKKKIPQKDVSFEIYKKDGTKVVQNIYYPEHREISVFKTSEQGIVELPEPLVAGEYYIKEITFPKNYVVEDTKVDFTVSRSIVEETNGILVIDITNKPAYGEIVISKTGDVVRSFVETTEIIGGKEYKVYSPEIGRSLLAGVKFDIFAGENIYSGDGDLQYRQGDKVTSLVTNAKEPIKTERLYFGKYIIREVEAPEGYARQTADLVIELSHKDPTQELISESFSLNNQLQTAKLSVKKYLEESKHFGRYEEALKDVVFALVTKEDLEIPESSLPANRIVGISRPDKDGIVSFEKVLPGKYRLVELSTSNAYELAQAEDVEFSPADDITLETEIRLKPITNRLKEYNLEITKVDADDPNFKLQGARFALYVKQGDKYVEVDRGFTSKDGKLKFDGLNSGNYYLREIEAPSTHVKRPTLYQFSTENSAETIYTTFENDKTRVEISKVDKDGKEIAGASLEVLDQDNNVIDSWISEEGKTHVIQGLVKGETYILREVEAPEGYVKAEDIEFTINEDGTPTKVKMINELVPKVPATGETGIRVVLGSLILILATGLILLRRRSIRS